LARIQFADFWPQLMGLVPAYSRDGVNGTSILLEKNPTIFSEFKTKTLLAQLTRTFLMEPRVVQAAKSEIASYYESQGKKLPSRPTINKYYNMDSIPENPNQNLIKDKVFDHEPFRSAITEILRKKQPEESMH
jgi:hypothetical protein